MAAKNAKKQKEKKGKKNQVVKEEKIAVLEKTEMKEDIPKIKAIVNDGLNAKPPLTYEAILKNVLKHHPESKFNKKHLSWYKNKLKEGNKKE
jgi:hypothetical protein